MKIFIGLMAASWLLCATAQAQRSTPTDDQLVTPAQKRQRVASAEAVDAAQQQQTTAGKRAAHDTRRAARKSSTAPLNEPRTTKQPNGDVDKAAHRAMRADKKRTRSLMQ